MLGNVLYLRLSMCYWTFDYAKSGHLSQQGTILLYQSGGLSRKTAFGDDNHIPDWKYPHIVIHYEL